MEANTRLRQARIARNWRQSDLADQLGTTVITIRRWERGSHQPSAYYRVKLCALFDKSVEELGLVATDAPDEKSGLVAAVPDEEQSTTLPPSRAFKWTGQLRRTRILAIVVILALVLSGMMWAISARYHPSAPTPGAGSSKTPDISGIDPRSTVDPYNTDNTLALSDDLTNATPNLSQWVSDPNGQAHGCFFRNHTYDVLLRGLNYCVADNTNFANFVYQIQLKILQGHAAGIIFRTNDGAAQTYYIFEITVDGSFFVQRNESSEDDTQLITENSSAIRKGFDQPNTIAVDANGGEMTFYINGRYITRLTDSSYSSGLIGVIVGEQSVPSDAQTITEATYNYVRVWI